MERGIKLSGIKKMRPFRYFGGRPKLFVWKDYLSNQSEREAKQEWQKQLRSEQIGESKELYQLMYQQILYSQQRLILGEWEFDNALMVQD